MESIGYLLIYFLRGNLPWDGVRAANRAQKFKKIQESKVNTPVEDLCKNQPSKKVFYGLEEFRTYLSYCKNLRFEEKPDYMWIKNLFRNLYFKDNEKWDNIFDWNYLHVRKILYRIIC